MLHTHIRKYMIFVRFKSLLFNKENFMSEINPIAKNAHQDEFLYHNNLSGNDFWD